MSFITRPLLKLIRDEQYVDACLAIFPGHVTYQG